MFMDLSLNVIVSDYSSHRVRKIDTNNIISTLAGTGVAGISSGFPCTSSTLSNPTGVWVDSLGAVYVNSYGGAAVSVFRTTGVRFAGMIT